MRLHIRNASRHCPRSHLHHWHPNRFTPSSGRRWSWTRSSRYCHMRIGAVLSVSGSRSVQEAKFRVRPSQPEFQACYPSSPFFFSCPGDGRGPSILPFSHRDFHRKHPLLKCCQRMLPLQSNATEREKWHNRLSFGIVAKRGTSFLLRCIFIVMLEKRRQSIKAVVLQEES